MVGTKYDWGSLTGVAAALGLVLCLFCLFWACYVRKPRNPPLPAAQEPTGAAGQKNSAAETPSVRLERLMNEKDHR